MVIMKISIADWGDEDGEMDLSRRKDERRELLRPRPQNFPVSSGKNVMNQVAIDIGEPALDAVMEEGQALVINAE